MEDNYIKIPEFCRIIREIIHAAKENSRVLKTFHKVLSEYTDFDLGETGEAYRFTHCKALSDMFTEYPLQEIAGNGDTMSKARRIMQWIDDNSSYNGASSLPPCRTESLNSDSNKKIRLTAQTVQFCLPTL